MKQHLAGGVMSSCGDSDGIPQIFSSQEGRKSKLLLPEEEPEDADMLEIGIEGAVTHHYGGAGSSDMDIDEDEFNGLSKLKSRKSSPIKRLLQDVDICGVDRREDVSGQDLAGLELTGQFLLVKADNTGGVSVLRVAQPGVYQL